MNAQSNEGKCGEKAAYVLAVLGAFLIVSGLVLVMRHYLRPPPLNTARAAERAKALVEMRAADADALANVGWVDSAKGIVRLPIADAMKMVEQGWQNPPAARSNLIARQEKASYVPPPPKPKPSEFE
jgi:hypothetical protein